ncbi:MAG: mechanosensitive ion channel family protein [Phycisphaerales bacterium]|nr:mechanosensitive ion channel family protein [Phycisphaerales bacterium]MBT7171947.1 mechanosensitive ion channel family protein [Phycisphaerales bacterium]
MLALLLAANSTADATAAAASAAAAESAPEASQTWLSGFTLSRPEALLLAAVLVGSVIVGHFLSALMTRVASMLARRKIKGAIELSIVFKSVSKPMRLLTMGISFWGAKFWIDTINTAPGSFYLQSAQLLIALAVVWALYRAVNLVSYLMNHLALQTDTKLDDQLVPIVRKLLRTLVVIFGVWFIAENIYVCDLSAIIAGLGIGGLAFAFAAKDMLSNLFGSVTIFADRPFKLGDRVTMGGYTGDVIDVGFRTTRIRTLEGHVITLPNGVIANAPIENVSSRPSIKRVLDIGVTYDTTPEKMEQALAILRKMLDARRESFHEDNADGVAVFTDFADSAMIFKLIYWFVPCDWDAYLAFNHEFNMELLRRFNEAGIEFAYPTQTLYLKQE